MSISQEIFYSIERFLEMLASERGCAHHTLEAYRRDLLKWADFIKEISLKDLDIAHRQAYISHLEEQGLSKRSIARHLSSLRQWIHFLVTEGVLLKDPWEGHKAPRYPSTLPRVLSLPQIQHVLRHASCNSTPEGRRLWAILELLYATGMRITELLTLPLSSLPPEGAPSFLIRGKGGHERFVFLTPPAEEALGHYLTVRSSFAPHFSPYLFASQSRQGHLTRQRVGQLLKELALECGMDPAYLFPHALRHAFATHLLHQGVDLITLKQLLGHQDISTTQIYTHVESKHWAEMLSKLHPLSQHSRPCIPSKN